MTSTVQAVSGDKDKQAGDRWLQAGGGVKQVCSQQHAGCQHHRALCQHSVSSYRPLSDPDLNIQCHLAALLLICTAVPWNIAVWRFQLLCCWNNSCCILLFIIYLQQYARYLHAERLSLKMLWQYNVNSHAHLVRTVLTAFNC